MTEPTDAEIVAVMRDGYNCRYNDEQDHIDFARAVLAKWGTPPAVAGEPVAYRYKFKEDLQWQYTCNKSQAHRLAVVEPLYTTPQPTQAQAGAVPLTDEQIQEAILPINPHGMGYFLRIASAIERAHGIGIKKGDSHV